MTGNTGNIKNQKPHHIQIKKNKILILILPKMINKNGKIRVNFH